ncbi:hypothetical protein FBZ94_105608 [Bradyrhizobium sacchari]|uniref:Uncharacterized protein n=1 Tax=Bradyrhizobium sacchari TaxID=1399419 RepID=A0A560JMB7_9BRAD|nr:hypothetical protein FBZ94_105608 [Bradyrhizobium sacchari]TWB72308.1 hypothetical protein FBZ95_10623 [Bradyrhizobium sacchari]
MVRVFNGKVEAEIREDWLSARNPFRLQIAAYRLLA